MSEAPVTLLPTVRPIDPTFWLNAPDWPTRLKGIQDAWYSYYGPKKES